MKWPAASSVIRSQGPLKARSPWAKPAARMQPSCAPATILVGTRVRANTVRSAPGGGRSSVRGSAR